MLALVDTLIAIQRFECSSPAENRNRFADVADHLQQFVWAADRTAQTIFCGRRYLEYTGAVHGPEMTTGSSDHLHPGDREEAETAWQNALRDGHDYIAKFRLRRHDGVYHRFQAWAKPIRNEAGDITGWLGVSHDTDEALAQEQLRVMAAKLGVAQRLAASIAHEINNPLEAVMNSIYLALQDGSVATDTRAYLVLAEQEMRRVALVTRHAFRFHRQQDGLAPADPGALMDEVFALHHGKLLQKKIALGRQYRLSRTVHCLREDIRVVFSSLVCNAADAMTTGGDLRVRISDAREARSGAQGVRVTVADSGEGIARSLCAQVFEPFFSTRGITRTGLALWQSKQIVERHGGTIRFRSRCDGVRRGTVFSIFLPFGVAVKGASVTGHAAKPLQESGVLTQTLPLTSMA